MSVKKKAVVLLSGGLDSTTVLAIAKKQGFDLYALSFAYGQRHLHEIRAAKKIAERFEVSRHLIQKIDLRIFGGSALTSDLNVPKNRSLGKISREIHITYVPAMNLIFLSFALAWAEVLGANDIFIGVNALDYSGYPDCRPEFIESFRKTANLATKAGTQDKRKFRIHVPLMRMSKAQIIKKGIALGVDYSLTTTCYDPDRRGRACGKCDACRLRLKGFAQNNLSDPAEYRK